MKVRVLQSPAAGTIGRVTNPAVLALEPPEVYRPLLPATPFILE